MHAFLVFAFLTSNHLVNANQLDTLRISGQQLEMNRLKGSSSTYLVYIEKPDNDLLDVSIWERSVGSLMLGDQKVMKIEQSWRNVVDEKERHIISYCRWNDFGPIYHRSSSWKSGEKEVEAFQFDTRAVVGADSVKDNQKEGFEQLLESPTLNWELDMEIFQTLPFQERVVFAINFYHPGSKKGPMDYYYSVGPLEELPQNDGTSVKSWALSIDYGNGNQATFWIAQKTREVLRMEERFGDIRRYKIKLP